VEPMGARRVIVSELTFVGAGAQAENFKILGDNSYVSIQAFVELGQVEALLSFRSQLVVDEPLSSTVWCLECPPACQDANGDTT
jgi:hypothetical protein